MTHNAISPNSLIHATYVPDGEVRAGTVGGAQEPSSAELARRETLKREAGRSPPLGEQKANMLP
jgi:hypothetical protein